MGNIDYFLIFLIFLFLVIRFYSSPCKIACKVSDRAKYNDIEPFVIDTIRKHMVVKKRKSENNK